MPKRKETTSTKQARFVKEFGSDQFKAVGRSVLFCKVCESDVAADQHLQHRRKGPFSSAYKAEGKTDIK